MTATKKTRTAWAWTLSTWFGCGFGRPGPGTYGSVAAVLLWYAAAHFAQPTPASLKLWTLAAAVIITLVGIPTSTITAREAGREDPGFVVIDEVAGQLIALIPMRPDWKHTVVALILFRVFDIVKPWPIRRLEALPEGTGIMLDDVAAGLIALIAGVGLSRLF